MAATDTPRCPTMDLLPPLLHALDDALQLEGRAQRFNLDTPLLGALPELDSMGAVALVSHLEQQFGVVFDDADLHAQTFATVGSLLTLVQQALNPVD